MDYYQVVVRLLVAVAIGGLIGFEREHKNMPAGFRTHVLVCVGAAVTSMIQLYAVQDTSNMILLHPELANVIKVDVLRLGAQVITGVGFLGAGTIIHNKGSIKGLTTAASIWTVACVGLGVGFGYFFLSALAAIIIFVVLLGLKKVETEFIDKDNIFILRIEYSNKSEASITLSEYFKTNNIHVENVEFMQVNEKEQCNSYLIREYVIVVPKPLKVENIASELRMVEGIDKVCVISSNSRT
jgi:putative Mg2+ transporter-C (MgtC) family protein